MKSEKIITSLIKQGESNQLELKSKASENAVAKIVCGFLNAEGGRLLIGVDENGIIIGVENAGNLAKQLGSFLLNAIVPEAMIVVTTVEINNKVVLLVEVVEGAKKPYIFDGVIYYRAGTQTRPANSAELLNLIHNRSQAEAHWERQSALGVESEDLEYTEIKNTLNYIKETGRVKIQVDNEDAFLKHYGLLQNGNLTNAALVLFAKEPTRFLPQCRVRITVFSTDKTGERYEFDRILEGNLFQNVEEIQKIFETILGNYSTFSSESWVRKDRPKYPLLALREGVLNALIHRDYSNVSGGVSISIYPDRLEISNYGELPDELKVNDLKRNHPSLPRNPDIAHIFFLRGLIEQIGRGTLYILDYCQKAGLRTPQWVSKSGMTTLTFFNDTIEIIDVEHLNERQLKLIALLETGAQITANDYFKFINEPISDRSARNDLAALVKGNWFKKQGQAKNTIYLRTEKQLQ